MIRSFGDMATEDIWNGDNTTAARRIARDAWKTAQRKLDMIQAAHELNDLRIPPGNRLEKLKGAMQGFHSIRVNDRYRVIFRWVQGAAEAVAVTDCHRG